MTSFSSIRSILSLIISLILKIVDIMRRKWNWHTTKSFKKYIIQLIIMIKAALKMYTGIDIRVIIGNTLTQKPLITI